MTIHVSEAMKPLRTMIRDNKFDRRALPILMGEFANLVAVLIDKEPDEGMRMLLNAKFDEALLKAVHQNEMTRRLEDQA
jgi:hypothetical protein